MKTSFWKHRRVLLTGATGLVGFWLTKELVKQEAHVVALVRDHDPQSAFFSEGLDKQVSVISGELSLKTIERALCCHEIDTVLHLAAQTLVGCGLRAPLETFESNIRGTYHLLEACRHQASYLQSIVIASTDKAYGTSPVLPYTESMPMMGEYPYDVSKSCCDLISLCYARTYRLPISVVRCGNIYGGHDLHWSRIIPGTIRSLHHGQQPIVRSDGTFIRDYLYINDAVDGYMRLVEKMHEGVGVNEGFNFAPNRPHTALEIVKTIGTMMQSDLEPIILNEAKTEIQSQYLSSKKAQEFLGWKAQYSLDAGLEKTIEWYVQYLNERKAVHETASH